MSSLKVNPFYIDPNQDDEEVDADEWGWVDDTDDLEELLGDGESDQYPPPKNGRQSSTFGKLTHGHYLDCFEYQAIKKLLTTISIS
jgi:hypothetical protein